MKAQHPRLKARPTRPCDRTDSGITSTGTGLLRDRHTASGCCGCVITTFGFGARRLQPPSGDKRHHGHQRSAPVHHGQCRRADRRSFEGVAGEVGLQRVTEGLHGRDKTRSEMASDPVFSSGGGRI